MIAIGTGLQVTRSLRAGVTLNRWFNGYHQSRARTGSRRQRQELDYDDLSGWNVNLGLIWTPQESLNLGLVGKTPFTGSLQAPEGAHRFLPDRDARDHHHQRGGERRPAAGLPRRRRRGGLVAAAQHPHPLRGLHADVLVGGAHPQLLHRAPDAVQPPSTRRPPDPVVFPELPYPTLDGPRCRWTPSSSAWAWSTSIIGVARQGAAAGRLLPRPAVLPRGGRQRAASSTASRWVRGSWPGPSSSTWPTSTSSGTYLDPGEPRGRVTFTVPAGLRVPHLSPRGQPVVPSRGPPAGRAGRTGWTPA